MITPNHIHLIWLIENGFQGKEGQKVPHMSDEWVNEISNRYIELYEKVSGKKFEKAESPNKLKDVEVAVLKALERI